MPAERALFLAARWSEAALWARWWGFLPHEWRYIGSPQDIVGTYNVGDIPVFVAGGTHFDKRLLMYLERAGFTTFIDAHDHPTERDWRSALRFVQ